MGTSWRACVSSVAFAALTGCWTQPSTLGLPCVSDSECDVDQRCEAGHCAGGSILTDETAGATTAGDGGTTGATTTTSATSMTTADVGATSSGDATSEDGTSATTSVTELPMECPTPDCALSPQWSVAYGDAKIVNKALDVDGEGNIYVGGVYQGSVTVNGQPTLIGAADLFSMYVIKFAPNGVPLWVRGFGADESGGDELLDLVVTDDGTVYFTGFYTGPLIMCNQSLIGFPNRQDLFVARINAAGTCDAIAAYAKDGAQRGFSLAYDAATQRLALAGAYQGLPILEEFPLPAEQIGSTQGNGLLALYDADLDVQWAVGLGKLATYESVNTARVGPPGSLLITGTFTDAITLLSTHASQGGTNDAFLARVSQLDGAVEWDASLVTAGGVTVTATDYDPLSGSFVIAGDFASSLPALELDSGSLDNHDIFVASLDAETAEVQWARQLGGASAEESARGLVIDPVAGHVLLSAGCAPGSELGAGPLDVMGSSDACLVRLRLDTGEVLWTERFGGSTGNLVETGRQLAVDLGKDPALLWAGDFYGTASFGGVTLTAKDTNARTFLVRFAP
ncbi:MAG: hypothetical protein KC468_09770 [Myxococcales bacterium]|nr:hypothetical protein [Myxococcales bacterium]